MNVLALLAGLALCSCALGVLGLSRVQKPRRQSLKSVERTCMLDSLSLPPLRQQQQQRETVASQLVRVSATLVRALISPLLAPLTGVEQGTTSSSIPAAATTASAMPSPPIAIIPRFTTSLASLVHSALQQFSGLSLLMANDHDRAAAPTVVTATTSHDSSAGAFVEQLHTSKRIDHTVQQPTADDSDADDSDDMFEDSSAGTNAQHSLFDGLQFYNVLSQVGIATVESVVHAAIAKSTASLAQRAAIEQRYPDILCLSAPAYAQSTTRTDLATALLAVSAAMKQQQQRPTAPLLCSSMERRLSTKRPESLAFAFAAEDGMESTRRTPLTSPSGASASAQQLEPSYLQAA